MSNKLKNMLYNTQNGRTDILDMKQNRFNAYQLHFWTTEYRIRINIIQYYTSKLCIRIYVGHSVIGKFNSQRRGQTAINVWTILSQHRDPAKIAWCESSHKKSSMRLLNRFTVRKRKSLPRYKDDWYEMRITNRSFHPSIPIPSFRVEFFIELRVFRSIFSPTTARRKLRQGHLLPKLPNFKTGYKDVQ
jgi:hypothetical protein